MYVVVIYGKCRIMETKNALAVALLTAFALGASVAANATPITGGIMFSDTFADVDLDTASTTIVSALTDVPVDPPQLAQGCTGSFTTGVGCKPSEGTFATSFTLADPLATQQLFTYNGFTFTMTGLVGGITRTGLLCPAGTCNDSLSFDAVGFVTGFGFTQTPITLHWQAFGVCSAEAGAATCQAGTASGHYMALVNTGALPLTLVAAAAVPEPGTLALLGISLGLLGLALRRPVLQ